MDTDWERHGHTPTWRRPAVATLAALGQGAIALGLIAFGTAIEQAAHPPTCHGIGFGCVPDPLGTAALVGMIIGVPLLLAVTVVSWIGWAATRHRGGRANHVATWWPVCTLVAINVVLAVGAVTAG